MAVLLGSAIAKSQTTDAPPPPPMHGHGFGMNGEGHRMGFFAKALNLTDDQKAQMKAIMQKEHPAMKPLFQQEHQIDQQLRQYVEGPFDQAKVQALATQKAQIEVATHGRADARAQPTVRVADRGPAGQVEADGSQPRSPHAAAHERGAARFSGAIGLRG